MLEKNPKTVKLVFKNFPLQMHQLALPAALAAMAAHEQGRFWEFHDKLFANLRGLNAEKIQGIAKELGLDLERFNKDMANPALRQKVMKDMQEGREAGVRGTPTIFINGRRLKERSSQSIQEMVNDALAAKK